MEKILDFIYRVRHGKLFFSTDKLGFVWRWFWNSEICEFLKLQPVFRTTFKQNLTCIFLSVRLKLLLSLHCETPLGPLVAQPNPTEPQNRIVLAVLVFTLLVHWAQGSSLHSCLRNDAQSLGTSSLVKIWIKGLGRHFCVTPFYFIDAACLSHCLDLDLNGLLTRRNFWHIPGMLGNYTIPK